MIQAMAGLTLKGRLWSAREAGLEMNVTHPCTFGEGNSVRTENRPLVAGVRGGDGFDHKG